MKVKELIEKLEKYDGDLEVEYQDEIIGSCSVEIIDITQGNNRIIIWTNMVGT